MTRAEPNPLRFELLKSDDYAHYIQRDPREVRFILRSLIERRAMLSAYYGPTGDFLLTTLLGLSNDENSLYLDWGADQAINAHVEASDQLTCMTQLDRVKIQFHLQYARPSTLAGAKAFVAPVPEALLRLQRREYYRLATPAIHGITCSVVVNGEGSDELRVDAAVLDISGGGLAVMVPPEGTPFEPDREFHHCRINLPEIGTIETKMRVRSVFRISAANGKPMLRAGCQFVRLPDSQVSMIQRYILRVERERAMRTR
jgi:c-di-GMP-binding flagellar brake protein YcgR